MSPDPQLQDRVRAALASDPRIPADADIAIAADNGVVTLRGTVASFKQRRAAVEDTESIHDVAQVFDDLKVHLLPGDVRDDELRGVALQALIWDSRVRVDEIDVSVANGWLTLTGEVKHQFQSDAAFEDVARLRGVGGVTNEIRVVTADPSTA